MTDKTAFSPDELLEKYRVEREKRLQMRPQGADQYIEIAGAFSEFDRDPYVEPGYCRAGLTENVDVVIVGGGLGGMLAAARLSQQGIRSTRIVEKAGDFGGTWYWNRYPGAACDVESYIYMPFLEETGYVPSERYAKAPEIFEHCQRIAKHFELYPLALFQTEVSELRWHEDTRRWELTTDRGDHITARFAIVAGGVLHKPKLPGIPGISSFEGHSFHTCRWDYDYTGGSSSEPMDKLADKRVAIIGTGATAIQAVPKLAEAAQRLYVVQRTPAGVGTRGNRPTDPEWASSLEAGWQQKRMENFTAITAGEPWEEDLIQDGWTEIYQGNRGKVLPPEDQQTADLAMMDRIRARIDEIVPDKATAEALKPWYHRMCKRPCFHDEFLHAFARPNVTLLDTAGRGVERITAGGLVVDGVEYPVDCIIYASGFELQTSYKRRLGFEIFGHDGHALSEVWADGPKTLHGMFAHGFPNLLMFSTTQGGWAINFSHMLNELAVHAASIIRRCFDEDIETIEATREAEDAWWEEILRLLPHWAAFMAQCTPSYLNGEGASDPSPAALRISPYFGGPFHFINLLRAWRQQPEMAGLETRPSRSSM